VDVGPRAARYTERVAPFTWAILRPREDADALAASLGARGVRAHATPAIERTPLAWPSHSDECDLVLLTSAFAASLVAQRAVLRSRAVCGATRPATASAARALGLEVAFEADGGAAELGQACAQWLAERTGDGAAPRVLYPTSDAGADQPEQAALVAAVTGAGAQLVRFVAYSTKPSPQLAHDLLALPLSGAASDAHAAKLAVVIASPSAVDALAAVKHPPVHIALCVGGSTERAWHEHGLEGERILAPRGRPLVDVIAELDSHVENGDTKESA
jgi:uroporphyrinogen-III synthase